MSKRKAYRVICAVTYAAIALATAAVNPTLAYLSLAIAGGFATLAAVGAA